MNISVLSAWIPVLTAVSVNVILFAYFMGSMRAEIRHLEQKIDALGDSRLEIAVLKQRVSENESKLQTGTRRFDEIFRSLSALSRGETLPAFRTDKG